MIVPNRVAAFLKNKIRVGTDGSPFPNAKNFSYRDIWHEEHCTNFTVAKALQMDVLKDIHESVVAAANEGWTTEHFKKELGPLLRKKGWWGKKDMVDPHSGETVRAQLGSDRRLKTIYQTNIRSAYQQGKWERSQASDAHPFLLYRVGNSKEHRAEHESWDGLLLDKNDPWWNSHFPPNGWGCRCWTQAISEDRAERLKAEGFEVPPSVEGDDGYSVAVKTDPPPERYLSYINDRKGTIEKVPAGVDPAFNFNIGRAGRDLPVFDAFMRRNAEGGFHADIESVAKTILSNKIWRGEFDRFVKNAFDGTIQGNRSVAAGFIDGRVAAWLKKNAGIKLDGSVTIALEARLLGGPKGMRHVASGNAVGKIESRYILDALLHGDVYFASESNSKAKAGNLTYVFPYSENRFYKIIVNPSVRMDEDGAKSFIVGPVIRSVDTIGEEGFVWVQNNNVRVK